MAIDNLRSLLANKEVYPLIERPEESKYYLSPDEYNLILNVLQELIDDYNERIDGIDGVTLKSTIKSDDDATQPSDFNVFTSLKTLKEIQAVVSQANNDYLSKKHDDSAAGKIEFQKGLEVGDFQPGIQGGNISEHGDSELNSLKLREWLEVPELRYNRVEVLLGDKWRAPGGGIIQHVDPDAKIVTLKLEDGEIGAVAVNDLCFGIIHSLDPSENSNVDSDDGKGTRLIKGFATSYFKVEEIISNNGTNQVFRYSLRPLSASHTKQVNPKEFMHFVAFGNTSNPDRQNSAYETRTYERFLTGINNWEYTQLNIAAQFGDLSNLTAFGLNMEGYSIYLNNVYFTGNIQQVKAPIIINGFWHTWNGTEWVSTGYSATEPGTSPISIHLTNNNVTVYDDLVIDLSNTETELHIYEGENELTYNPSSALNSGQYIVNAVGTNITPGSITLNNIHAHINHASNLTSETAHILFTVTGKRLSGADFTIVINQNITKVERGRDGNSVEYIFAATETPNPPLPPVQTLPANQNDDYTPSGWIDDDSGISKELPYEWRAKRTKKDGVWSQFNIPHIVNKWGRDGQDGNAYEYIFKRTPVYVAPSPSPSLLEPVQEDDWWPKEEELGVGWDGWDDNAIGPTRDLEFEWACKRVKKGGFWGKFTPPALWAKYSKDGGSTETVYRRTSDYSPPLPLIDGLNEVQADSYIPTNWTRSPLGVNSDLRFEWMSERHKQNEVWSKFSPAAVHNVFAEDGKDIEFIFNNTATDSVPNIIYHEPDPSGRNVQDDEYLPRDGGTGTGWKDDAVEVTRDFPYLWMTKRIKVDGKWENFKTPSILSVHGKDGANYEYVFKLTWKDTPPQLIATHGNFQQDDYLPKDENGIDWLDDAASVSELLPYLWMSKRKKVDNVWQPFSDVSLIGNFSLAGANAKILSITASSLAMVFDKNKVIVPQTITLTAKLQNLVGTATFQAIPYIGSTPQPSINLGGSGNVRTLTHLQWANNVTRVVITVTLDDFEDVITIVKLEEGGDAVVGQLTNENVTFPSASDGSIDPSSYARANGNFLLFEGTTNVVSLAIFSILEEVNCSATINASGAYHINSMALEEDSASVTFRAVYKGLNIDKVLTLSKSKDGLDGLNGAMVEYWGDFDLNTEYFGYNYKIVAVRYDGVYYKSKPSVGGTFYGYESVPTQPLPENSYWENFGGSFKSIATDLLLAVDANIANFWFKTNPVTGLGRMESRPLGKDHSHIAMYLDGKTGEAMFSSNKVLFREDGSGYLAGGNITWDPLGAGTLAGGNISWNAAGDLTVRGAFESNSGPNRVSINKQNNIIYGYKNNEVMFSLDFSSDDGGIFGYTDWGTINLYGRPPLAGQLNPMRTRLRPGAIDVSGILGSGSFFGLYQFYILKNNGDTGINVDLSHTARPGIGTNIMLLSLKNLPTSSSNLISGEVYRDGNNFLKIVP